MNERPRDFPSVEDGASSRRPLLGATGVHKRFGGVRALRGAQIHVSGPGAVHCLAGENGSGKSTLMGVLSGALRPDAGYLEMDGARVHFGSPHDALKHGIAMVSQETAVVPDLTVTENILLGRRLVRSPVGINWASSHERARAVLEQLSLDYDPRWILRDLSADKRQMVEVARALSTQARVLILDEPTSSLTSDEVDHLMQAVRRVAATGVGVLFVSHRLAEVFEICTEVTVLRDGCTVSSGPIAGYTKTTLVAAMVGTGAPKKTSTPERPRVANRVHLALRGLGSAGSFADISLDAGSGDIVGLAGLAGSGRTELLQAIFGCRTVTEGIVELDGADVSSIRGITRVMNAGIGYLPPDRKTDGLVLSLDAATNLSMAATSSRSRLAWPDRRRESRRFEAAGEELKLRAASPWAPVKTLSGGNQQKVALGKWIVRRPKVLLLDEPTRGVDVAAKADIHSELRRLAALGSCLLVSSSEYDELLALCTRVIVMFRGRVVADLCTAETNEAQISALAGGETGI
jgi:ABC-type sugar transport system ATPase subunit